MFKSIVMKSQKTATSSVMLLHATACAGKNGWFDYIKNSEWNCTPGGHAEMPHALKKRPGICSILWHAEGKEGQKPPCALPLIATCYQRGQVPCRNAGTRILAIFSVL